ncbi:MAG: sigma-54 dependent transcriptional regulator [Pseudomonadota bacterium]|nr:sigma-54 dependent transcriptional regulator [Pseudomonadota bacterium]
MGTIQGVAPRQREVVLLLDSAAPARARSAARALVAPGREVLVSATAREGLALLDGGEPDVIVASLDLPDLPGLRLVEALRAQRPGTPIIVLTEAPTVQGAVAALRAGAADYLGADALPEALAETLRAAVDRALSALRAPGNASEGPSEGAPEATVAERSGFTQQLTRGPKMTRVFDAIRAVAQTDATVLVRGEPGTGTELVARGIHERSRRRGKRLVGVNCGALTEAELSIELFGHAKSDEPGAFELAEGGTLFLDELGEASLPVQVQLLRVLEEQRFRLVGGTALKRANVRVIAATDADLDGAVSDGRFREDLYYRLNVFPIAVPPLRQRVEDLPLLVRHFLNNAAGEYDLPAPEVTAEAMALLARYPWPGNVRQLRAMCERWVIECRGAPLGPQGLPEAFTGALVGAVPPEDTGGALFVDETLPLATLTARMTTQLERTYLHKLLARNGGHLQNTATAAGMTRRTLYSRMKALGIEAKGYK